MTDLRKVAQMALDTLERWSKANVTHLPALYPDTLTTIEALRQALAQPVVDRRLKVKLGRQYGRDLNGHWFYLQPADECADQALTTHSGHTAPPKREWVGLTKGERTKLWNQVHQSIPHASLRIGAYGDFIEAMLEEKNK